MKVYLICTYTDNKAASINDCPNIGIEYMGDCGGVVIKEDGSLLGQHHSSSFGWLRNDLIYKLGKDHGYEVVDLIGKELPDNVKELLK